MAPTRYCPNLIATEVLLGIPPMDIVVRNLSAKYQTKVQFHDPLRKQVSQQQNSVNFITTLRKIKQIYNLKRFDLSDDQATLKV